MTRAAPCPVGATDAGLASFVALAGVRHAEGAAGADILPRVTDDVVELALVGAGRMGRMHLRALDPAGGRTGAVRVTDVVEPVAAAREALRGSGHRVHATLADLLAARRPDGVLVAAPTGHHADVARAALGAGIPVLCEKPAGLTWQEVEETGRIADDRGVAFQVAYWRRFVPGIVALRERIVAGELGQILHVVCAQWDGAPPPPQFRHGSGGAFVDMGVHEFDVVRWVTGRWVESVAAVQTPALDPRARPDVDNAQALLGLFGGTTAAVSLGRHHPDGDMVTIEVFGSTGHERLTVLDPHDGDEPMLDALARQADSFAELVRGGPRRGAGTADAVAALRVAARAAQASSGSSPAVTEP
jgi:myo-inositol 2-dehydrogenase/D-chiro-inositol 1-dehydrogenase